MTVEELRILEGKEGSLKKRALELIVAYAEALGALRLCKISKAHLYAGAHQYLRIRALEGLDPDQIISKMHFCSDERMILNDVACFAQTDAGPMDPDQWSKLGFSFNEATFNDLFLCRYLHAGIHLIGTCAPYLTGFIPLMGEHYVSTESHAVTLMNSIWGACANADGIEIAFCSAFCGFTPYWGNHVPEQRKATHLIQIDWTPSSIHDWDALGYAIGRKAPAFCTPLLTGNFPKVDINRLRACFAAMAASSGVEMCHILGHTPEALTREMATGNNKVESDVISEKEISEVFDLLGCRGGEVCFVSLGCPHFSIEQIKEVSQSLSGRKIHPRVEFQVWTAAAIKSISDRCGYTDEIEKAGGNLVCGSCPLLTGKFPDDGQYGLLFDSAKQANYVRSKVRGKVHYGTARECVEAAVSGVFNPGS